MTEHHEWSRHTGLHTNSHTRPITDIIVASLLTNILNPGSGARSTVGTELSSVTTVCRIVPRLPLSCERDQLQVPTLFVLFAPARHVKCDRCQKMFKCEDNLNNHSSTERPKKCFPKQTSCRCPHCLYYCSRHVSSVYCTHTHHNCHHCLHTAGLIWPLVPKKKLSPSPMFQWAGCVIHKWEAGRSKYLLFAAGNSCVCVHFPQPARRISSRCQLHFPVANCILLAPFSPLPAFSSSPNHHV